MDLNLLLSFADIKSKIVPFLIAILFFGVIILIHEFGHFIFAKAFGVKVNEFAIGMGPTILKKQGKETKYALRLFPIGGFVAMEGEEETSEDKRAYCNQKIWKRMIIIAAGATFNLILGLIMCVAIIGSQDMVGIKEINSFDVSAVSNAEGGLMPGDEFVKIDGKRVFSYYDISFLMQRNSTGVYDFVVERDGEKVELKDVKFGRRTTGNFSVAADGTLSGISEALITAGLSEGDRITAINGEAMADSTAIIKAIAADEDYIIDFTVERDGETLELVDIQMNTDNLVTVIDFSVVGEDNSFLLTLEGGFGYAISMGRMVYLSLFDLLRGQYGMNDLAGPIGTISVITDIAETSAQTADYSSLFIIMAMITINIGLFNLLPVPALDGGHLFFMFVELIIRKPIPKKYESYIHAAGLVLLLGFMAIISASDIWKLISGKGFY